MVEAARCVEGGPDAAVGTAAAVFSDRLTTRRRGVARRSRSPTVLAAAACGGRAKSDAVDAAFGEHKPLCGSYGRGVGAAEDDIRRGRLISPRMAPALLGEYLDEYNMRTSTDRSSCFADAIGHVCCSTRAPLRPRQRALVGVFRQRRNQSTARLATFICGHSRAETIDVASRVCLSTRIGCVRMYGDGLRGARPRWSPAPTRRSRRRSSSRTSHRERLTPPQPLRRHRTASARCEVRPCAPPPAYLAPPYCRAQSSSRGSASVSTSCGPTSVRRTGSSRWRAAASSSRRSTAARSDWFDR